MLFIGEPTPTIDDKSIEAAAREMLRERIEATPWYRIGMTSKQRQQAIEREVETYWRLFVLDAAKQLHVACEDDKRQPSETRSSD